MDTVVIRINMPAAGELQRSEEGSDATQDQMDEEERIQQELIDFVSPQLASLVERSPRRSGNVSRVQLLGTDVWSQMNHFLLLISVDIGDPSIDLHALVPPGGKATRIGSYSELRQWPEQPTD
jgi:hypothetical protein